jgi:hypothetical protein
MTIAGPFDTREQADDWHTENLFKEDIFGGMLVQGPDNLGPEWQKNVTKWKQGLSIQRKRTALAGQVLRHNETVESD